MKFVDQFYRLELSRGVPWTYAAASDMLRVEILYRFGGAYSDGDNRWLHLRDFDAVAAPNTVGMPIGKGKVSWFHNNNAIISPAKHTFLLNWLERLSGNYFLGNADIHRTAEPARQEDYLTWDARLRRYSTFDRVGPGLVSEFSTHGVVPLSGIAMGGANMWLSRQIKPADEQEIPEVLRKIVSNLVRDVYNRGDLNLVGVVDLVRRLPEWSAAWTAVIAFIASQPELVENIRYITTAGVSFRYPIERIELPEEARVMIRELNIRVGFLNGMRRIPVQIPLLRLSPTRFLRQSVALEVREDPDSIDVLRYPRAIDFRSRISDPGVDPGSEARKFDNLVLEENQILLSVPLTVEGVPVMTRIGVMERFEGEAVLDQLHRLNLDPSKVQLIWYHPRGALSGVPRGIYLKEIVNGIGLPVIFPKFENKISHGKIVYIGYNGGIDSGAFFKLKPDR
jgi:hypothetical protein